MALKVKKKIVDKTGKHFMCAKDGYLGKQYHTKCVTCWGRHILLVCPKSGHRLNEM